jgi:hypothetical protein
MPIHVLQMTHKPFDAELYDDDDDAKHLVVEWLGTKQFNAYINPDQYGIDVLADKNDKQYGFEVEVKHNWNTPRFPYDTVHFAGRKQKFIAPNHYFTMLNHNRTQLLLVDGATLAQCKLVTKNTKYTTSEQFIEVPAGLCKFRIL